MAEKRSRSDEASPLKRAEGVTTFSGVPNTNENRKEKKVRSYFPTGPKVDLMKYDLPQPESALEWWYFNSHVRVKATGQPLSCFASFFRQVQPKQLVEPGKERGVFDAVMWAISDAQNKVYDADSLLEGDAPNIVYKRLRETAKHVKLNHLEMALMEVVEKGEIIAPDRLMQKKQIAMDKLSINLNDECIVTKLANNKDYDVKLFCPGRGMKAHLVYKPRKEAILHGTNGIVNDMFYYYISRMEVTGTVWLASAPTVPLEVEGEGWYDREFGGERETGGERSRDALDAWTWISAQLSNGSEISIFVVEEKATKEVIEHIAVYCDKDGKRTAMDSGWTLTSMDPWASMITYTDYPQRFLLDCPAIDLKIEISTEFAAQEFITLVVGGGGFWEGRVVIKGTQRGQAVTGVGFLEKKNHKDYDDTKGLLTQVGKVVHRNLARLYPLEAPKEWIDKNVLGRNALAQVNPKDVCDVLFKPSRAIIDRSGKSWRSLILVSVINAISIHRYVDTCNYIAIGELLHVGSLIIDDIQDDSTIRRGGPCAHLEFGVAHAINSATACYFMAPILAGLDDLPPHKQLPLYRLYFDSLRAGHAGQGLDILGLNSYMPEAIATGDATKVESALRAIHVYKTGGPAGALCRMACIIVDATEEQALAVDNFGTKVGLAFQIVDDALNVQGFEGNLKELGEDIRDGKITYPVVRAIPRLSSEKRNRLWDILKQKTSDVAIIKEAVELMDSVNAIEDCLQEAKDLVEEAWKQVDKVLPNSLPKLMMRAFTFYLTERKK